MKFLKQQQYGNGTERTMMIDNRILYKTKEKKINII